jgi:hypothetical protein
VNQQKILLYQLIKKLIKFIWKLIPCLDFPKESVIFPHIYEKDGSATPIDKAVIVPIVIKSISYLVENLNN